MAALSLCCFAGGISGDGFDVDGTIPGSSPMRHRRENGAGMLGRPLVPEGASKGLILAISRNVGASGVFTHIEIWGKAHGAATFREMATRRAGSAENNVVGLYRIENYMVTVAMFCLSS